MAQARGVRLGRIIDDLAAEHAGGNLTSHLRVSCLRDAEQRAARVDLETSSGAAMRLFMSCPAPGILLTRDRLVVGQNAAFETWQADRQATKIGQHMDQSFKLRTAQPLPILWRRLMDEELRMLRAHGVHVAPGRILPVQITALAFARSHGRASLAIAWIDGLGKPTEAKSSAEDR